MRWHERNLQKISMRRSLGRLYRTHEKTARQVEAVIASSRPCDLGDRLAAAGLTLAADLTGMAMDTASFNALPLPQDVSIREVRNDEDLDLWPGVLSRGFEIPHSVAALYSHRENRFGYSASSPVRCFLGYHQCDPIACSMRALTNDSAGIYCVAILPEARPKGAGAAVTSIPVSFARDLGYHVAVLKATPMGRPGYAKLGFEEFGKISLYLRSKSRPE